MLKKIFLLLLLLIVVCVIGASISYYHLHKFAKQELHFENNRKIFTLEKGTSIHQLVEQVDNENLIANSYLLPYLYKLAPNLGTIKAGTYQLQQHMTVIEFLKLLVSGKENQFTLRLLEGKTWQDWQAVIKDTKYIEQHVTHLSADDIAKKLGIKGSIEGWLSPNTYLYTANTTDITLLKRAYKSMQTNLNRIWESRDGDLPYKNQYELLIMASIIEKETSLASERALVSSVFVNRLKANMRLQTDPTIIYGLGDSYTGVIRRIDITDSANVYNTYMFNGLPPTPITMPSLASLEAAAHPAETDYLYFVANGKGGHTFSTNYSNHLRAVNYYRKLTKKKN